MTSSQATRHRGAEQWIRQLEELTGNTFYPPAAPLAGAQLERQVADVLDALEDRRPAVAAALRGLYGAAAPDVPVHLANAAKAWAEVLSQLHPEHSFVGVVKPATVQLERAA